MEHLYTIEQASEALQVHPKTVQRWIREKKLKAVRAGKHWRIKESDLEAFLQADTGDSADELDGA